ncbi:PREDICTED: classical arabinogalactan protein 25-like [Lupinus angustifolius]|uniref:classical arabinogalactan protein 25-like n=1 Tax=Lupinus angustifolius TaxID=3871 RepID=UPI00092F6EF3|nr:PREDICTED: classical arabinogalactan protein 25-like [Lupinus angustifolius]
MASFCLLFSAMFISLIACNCSFSSASLQNMHVSTISTGPTLSPDIEPLFPTPSGVAFSPSESSLPTIPSSPSPPNSDANKGSIAVFPPYVSIPAPAPASKGASLPVFTILHLGIVVFCMMQLHGM